MPLNARSLNILRQQLRTQRLNMPVAERQFAALAVANQWEIMAAQFVKISTVAGYWACHGELDAAPLLERAKAAGAAIYLPVLDGDALQFAPYQFGTPLRCNRFQIPEPDVSQAEWCPPSALDLVLLPVVAFDNIGTRLGMGGGFYDRSFAFLRGQDHSSSRRPRLVGLAYEYQRVVSLIRQPWDVPLDAVVTENGFFIFKSETGILD